MSYVTDADLAGLFNGETVPGDNTINTTLNTIYKTRSYNKVHSVINKTSLQTDSHGDLLELQMYFYRQLLDGNPMRFNDDAPQKKNWYKIRYGAGVSLYMHDPTNHTKNT